MARVVYRDLTIIRSAGGLRFQRRAPTVETPSNSYARDPVMWAREVLQFYPDAMQAKALAPDLSRGLVNCTRQYGKTTIIALKAVHRAVFWPGSLVVVASPSQRQSGEFIRKARGFTAKLRLRVRGDGENRCSLVLPNGSRMVGLPDNPDTIRGFSGTNLLVIDEAARVSESMYEALRPMLATTGGALWAMSTPNGKEGFFYREWTGTAPWTRIEVPAAACPRIPQEFLEEERRTLGDEVFRQEYCCEFMSGEGALFDEALVRSKINRSVAPLW